ncbi:MAG: hypothetical protein JXA37_11705 [Chloroflexia bacterium]|nr:hypothetical protein [Chloroflexia bacterium]
MGTWQKTEQAGWITLLVVVPSVVVGGLLLWMGLNMSVQAAGDLGIPRKYELILLGAFFILSPLLGLLLIEIWVRRGQRRARRLRERGIPGTATLLNCEETGVVTNNAPQIALELEIETAQHPPYRLVHKECVGLLYLSRLAPGAQFEVWVDPEDPEEILLAWK